MNTHIKAAYEIMTIANRHNVTIEDDATIDSISQNLIDELRQRATQARTDARTLERLVETLPPPEIKLTNYAADAREQSQ